MQGGGEKILMSLSFARGHKGPEVRRLRRAAGGFLLNLEHHLEKVG
jgi:hypothetical protein